MSTSQDESTKLACVLTGEVVRTFGEVRLRVFGTSMVPSILPGDLISVQRASVSEISPGEIVLYMREGRLFAHRVVGSTGGRQRHDDSRLITRGDRLSDDDSPVSSSELLGRVTSIQCADGIGYRQVRSSGSRSAAERIMVRLLRISDRATYLYLRLNGYWRRIFSGGTACRA